MLTAKAISVADSSTLCRYAQKLYSAVGRQDWKVFKIVHQDKVKQINERQITYL